MIACTSFSTKVCQILGPCTVSKSNATGCPAWFTVAAMDTSEISVSHLNGLMAVATDSSKLLLKAFEGSNSFGGEGKHF